MGLEAGKSGEKIDVHSKSLSQPHTIGGCSVNTLLLVSIGAIVIVGASVGAAIGLTLNAQSEQGLKPNVLRILHFNDMHARVDGMNRFADACANPSDRLGGKCDGGWARMFTAARQKVQEGLQQGMPTLLVDDGDQFMGSVWSTFYKGSEASTFLNKFCGEEAFAPNFDHCVASLGNHEFDFGYDRAGSYVQALNHDVVCTNLVDGCAAGTLAAEVKKSKVLTFTNGLKVGVVGYLTPETSSISSAPPCVVFQDEITALQAEVSTLKNEVDVIICVGHSGYVRDQQVAAAVPEIDLIIGGHSHTFLWDEITQGDIPVGAGGLGTSAGGAYPTVVANSGGNTPVVQAFHGSRFMGMVDLSFSEAGALTSLVPGAFIVGGDGPDTGATTPFVPDPTISAEIELMRLPLNAFALEVIGRTDRRYTGDRNVVRVQEAALGNMICDAMLESINANTNFVNQFGNVDMCVTNSGGIRADLPDGNVTVGDVLTILPFGNVISVLRLTGQELYLACEHAVHRVGAVKGEFLQISKGLKFEYNPFGEPSCSGSTCVGDVQNNKCVKVSLNGVEVGRTTQYLLVTNNFVASGGDSFDVFESDAVEVILETGEILADLFKDYITAETAANGFVSAQVEGRITTITAAPSTEPTKAPTPAPTNFPTTPPIASPALSPGSTLISAVNNDIFANQYQFSDDEFRTIEGIVTADVTASQGGFIVQSTTTHEPGGASPAMSDSQAILVYCDGCVGWTLNEGDYVKVTGRAVYFSSAELPEISEETFAGNVEVVCDVSTAVNTVQLGASARFCFDVNVLDFTLPVASLDVYKVNFRQMLARVTHDLFVTDTFNMGRFGQLGMSQLTRVVQPSMTELPGTAGLTNAVSFNERSIVYLDDMDSTQCRDLRLWPAPGFNSTNFIRAGFRLPADVLSGTVMVQYLFDTPSLGLTLQGLATIPGAFDRTTNPRDETIPVSKNNFNVGAYRICSLNMLNYFTDLDDGVCDQIPDPSKGCRGADNAAEFARQEAKLYAAASTMDCAVFVLEEVQNDKINANDATMIYLAEQLSSFEGSSGKYQAVRTGTLGQDAIRVGMIYQPALVTTVGNASAFESFNPTGKSRVPMAQTFKPAGGESSEEFTVVAVHLKSKGSECDEDPSGGDRLEGEGNCGFTRLQHTIQMMDWIATNPTGTANPNRVMVAGDFNAYAKERVMTEMISVRGYVDLAARDIAEPYSFQFDGNFGTLDYLMASPEMATLCRDTFEWHINSDESTLLDYNDSPLSFTTSQCGEKNPGERDEVSAFRSSDHDPVITVCELKAPTAAPTSSGGTVHPTSSPSTPAPTGAPSSAPTDAPTEPSSGQLAFINELDADQTSGDTAEFIEVIVSATVTDLSTIRLTFYNGANGQSGASLLLNDASVSDEGVVFTGYKMYVVNIGSGAFLQNDMEGLSLDISSTLIEFICWDGGSGTMPFVGVGGPADGITCDVTTTEGTTTSVQRTGAASLATVPAGFTWAEAAPSSGSLNAGQSVV